MCRSRSRLGESLKSSPRIELVEKGVLVSQKMLYVWNVEQERRR